MIVTADPLGDFNATSQILRYSALAREITVPRIPSVSSTILAASTASHYFSPRAHGRSSPTDTERETMEIAALEIARLSEEIDGLRDALKEEQDRRFETEAHLESMTDRIMEMEMQVREEVFAEMEGKMQEEMRRWKASFAAEADRNDEHLDRKLEILTKTMEFGIDEDKENVNAGAEDLEGENERLREEVRQLRRELGSRSPSKGQRLPLRESKSNRTLKESRSSRGLKESMENLRLGGASERGSNVSASVSTQGSPLKKVRKFTAKKWDLVDGEEDF